MNATLARTAESRTFDLFAEPTVHALRAGDRIQGTAYRIQGHLASGGMGQLFEVVHEGLGRACVLKVLHERHRRRADLGERLRDEARVLASIGSAATPIVFDVGALCDDRPFFVMERIEGHDLRSELSRLGVLSVPCVIGLGVQLLAALAEVHGHGVVHRDVKLENLILTPRGRLKLLDFGVARRVDAVLRRTGAGVALGTPRTMAPEQHRAAEVDARADLYAAGLVLYELLVGTGPFDGPQLNAHGMRLAHCHQAPPAPSRRAPQPIPIALERVVLRALSKKPCARFESAAEMSAALSAAQACVAAYNDEEPTEVESWAPVHEP
jgi:serine/threonine protein kinase